MMQNKNDNYVNQELISNILELKSIEKKMKKLKKYEHQQNVQEEKEKNEEITSSTTNPLFFQKVIPPLSKNLFHQSSLNANPLYSKKIYAQKVNSNLI